jgi:hypothetical protein
VQEGQWQVRKGGNYVAYQMIPVTGSFSFTAALLKGRRLQWFVAYKDPRNHAMYQMEKRQLVVKDVVNGRSTERAKIAHNLGDKQIYSVQIDISADTVLTRVHDGSRWIVLDTWNAPGRNFSDGKFGFYIPGNDEYGLSNFKFTGK